MRNPQVRNRHASVARLLAAAAATLLAGWLGAACADGAPGGSDWAGQIDTLPSGTVHVTNPKQGLWTDETRWHLALDLQIGSLESDGPDLFGAIASVTPGPNGEILVLESQAHEVRVFDADGTWLRTIGREGQGPGELNVGFGGRVYVVGDEIWVDNSGNRRWERFSLEGEALGSLRITSFMFGAEAIMGDDGQLYRPEMVRASGSSAAGRSVIVRLAPDGDVMGMLDTVDAPDPGENRTVEVNLTSSGGNRMSMAFPIPFVQQPGQRFTSAGTFLVWPGNGYRFLEVGSSGDTLRVIERDYDPVPVSTEELDAAFESFDQGPLASADVDLSRSDASDTHPPFSNVRKDARGHYWVLRTLGDGETGWDIFDPDGRYLGAVSSDVALDRLSIHVWGEGFVYGVLRDELDVPYVVRLRIREGVAGSG